jgi:hypothetical protein
LQEGIESERKKIIKVADRLSVIYEDEPCFEKGG